jgi:putative Holliday junction resolvase
MGFDFGTRRIGVALGHELTATARPLSTLSSRGNRPDWAGIGRLIATWRPELVVVGIPYNLDGSEASTTGRARWFARQLKARFALPVCEADERLSTEAAVRAAIVLQPDKPLRKATLDPVAAAVILEGWLNDPNGCTEGDP